MTNTYTIDRRFHVNWDWKRMGIFAGIGVLTLSILASFYCLRGNK
jgi:hypothetical protein